MNKDMERIKENMNILKDCTLCPRNCHADRFGGQRGRCHETAEIVAARAALHMWKNPVYQEMQAPERYSFPAVRWAVSSVRTII